MLMAKAYFISIVWSCYKFLTMRAEGKIWGKWVLQNLKRFSLLFSCSWTRQLHLWYSRWTKLAWNTFLDVLTWFRFARLCHCDDWSSFRKKTHLSCSSSTLCRCGWCCIRVRSVWIWSCQRCSFARISKTLRWFLVNGNCDLFKNVIKVRIENPTSIVLPRVHFL